MGGGEGELTRALGVIVGAALVAGLAKAWRIKPRAFFE
jgi:hypothetical protein